MRQGKFPPVIRSFLLCLAAGGAALLLSGCSRPKISFTARTEIRANGQTARSVVITCKSTQKNEPPPNLTDFLRLPKPKQYQQFSPLPDGVSFSGVFNSPAKVPVDFMKLTPGFDIWAHNRLRLRHQDYVLLSTFEFEERVEDIVERAEADEALAQGVGLLLEAFLSGFDECYGEKYDLSRLDAYLRKTLPELSRRLYQALWEIRRSSRGGLDMELEVQEWDRRLRQEVSNYGLYLAPLTSKANRKTNETRAWEFLDTKLRELVTPRQPDTPPLRAEVLRNTENQQELFRQIESSINESFGSMEYFFKQIDPLIPVIFGAFFEQRLLFNYAEPEFNFHFQLYLPGHIMQTNGVRDFDGSVHWRFSGEDLHLTGYPMWVRSVGIDRGKTQSLGLINFPRNLATVDRFILAVTLAGVPDKQLLALLEKCVAEKSLRPLRVAAAGPEAKGAAAEKADHPKLSPQKAGKLLKLLEEFLPSKQAEGKTTPTAEPSPFSEFNLPPGPNSAKGWGHGVELKPFDIDAFISLDLDTIDMAPTAKPETAVLNPPANSTPPVDDKNLTPTLDDLE